MEGNEEAFDAAKNAIIQRVLAATVQAAFEDLGNSDAIARKALAHVMADHTLVRGAASALTDHLIEDIARRSIDELADTEGAARRARQRIDRDHEVVVAAKNRLKVHLIDEVVQGATDDLAAPNTVVQGARPRIEEEVLNNGRKALVESLLTEIADRSTESIADAQQAALEARNHIDDKLVGGAVAQLKERLMAEIGHRSEDDLADLDSTVDKALALVGYEHHVVLRAVDKLKEEILQTIVQQALAKISDEVCGMGELPTPKPVEAEAGLVEIARAAAESGSRGPEATASPPKMQRRKAANGYPEVQEIPPEAAPTARLAEAHYIHGIVAHRGRGLVEALAAVGSETDCWPYVLPFKTVAAVASRVPGSLTEDDGWKEALSGVQGGLLEHLSQAGAAVLPMYGETLYASEADLVATLAVHAQTLEAHLGKLSDKQEWAVKIYCDPEQIKQKVHSTDASIDAFLGQILEDVHEWSVQGPAKELKAVQEGMTLCPVELVETVQRSCQQSVHRALQRVSEDSRLASPSEEEAIFGQSRMVLRASYLVAESQGAAFRAELERLAADYEGLGLVYYVGGPHPPCRFTASGAPDL